MHSSQRIFFIKGKIFVQVVRCFTWVFLLILVPLFIRGQNLKFEHLSTDKGLSHSNVTCILQDSRGFMWFGTRYGLNKYDGYNFKVYKNSIENQSSLGSNRIMDMVEDADGNLWIALLGGGLDMFDWRKEKFVHYKNSPKNRASIPSNDINCLLQDDDGNLWIGSEDNGLCLYDKKAKKFIHYAHNENDSLSLSHNQVVDILEEDQDNLWISTKGGGVNLFNKRTKKFKHFLHDAKNSKSLASNITWCLFKDSRNQLWISTRGEGLDLFNPGKEEFIHFKNDPNNPNSLGGNVVLSLEEDELGNLWIGTENGGLSTFNLQTKIFYNYLQDHEDNLSLSNNSIWSLYKDANANMWVGTFSGGINFVGRDINKFTHYRHSSSSYSLSNNSVWAILEDSKDNLWLGTDGGGLNLLDRKTSRFSHYKHELSKNSICGDYVLSLSEDHKGNIWMGTWGNGITVFNKEKNTFKHFSHDPTDPTSLSSQNVWALFKDSQDNMWIGHNSAGIDLYDEKKNSFIHFKHNHADSLSVSNNTINTFFEDSSGNLWVGTYGTTKYGGLNLFDKEKKTFTKFLHDDKLNSISNDHVFCLTEDRTGNLWIGTEIGLNCFDRKANRFTNYFVKNGLPGNEILGVLRDEEGNLWISTNNGISNFNFATKTFKNFGVKDGIQSVEFIKGACKSRSGQLYFGGVNGFNEFFPNKIKDKKYNPPLVFTDFQIFNKQVEISKSKKDKSPLKKSITDTKELVLSHDQSVITFEFASLNYAVQSSKQYAYMLNGFDNAWNYIGLKHAATYTNLDPGTYTLNVKGQNNEGGWSSKMLTIKLTVTPPYWKTWWFRTLSFLFIVGSIFSYYRYRINAVRARQLELEEEVKRRTNEVIEQKETLQQQATFLQTINVELQTQKEEAENARLEAEQATRAKSVFLATMSHEIRTPMNGVIGMASLLAETSQTEEQQEYTETIRSCGESLLVVINDILDYSKIESSKMELEQKSFDLRTCIEEVLDVFAGKASELGLDLVYEIDFNVPPLIVGDSVRLRQVILNLVGNAIKFTLQGEIFVGVHLLHQQGDDVELSFEIRDTGIGIPKDKIHRLFKAFSQVDSSTTRKYGGTGLGLVICEKIVGLMGGQIQVESSEGLGTTFTFTIQSTISKQSIPKYIHHNTAHLEGKKVLIIDDNHTNRKILKNQLEQWKLLTTLAVSGAEALEILEQVSDFDLVISDMQMPEMDGIALGQQIKKKKFNLSIILLSSVGDNRTKEHDELFASVLTKPVRQSTLYKHVVAQFSPRREKIVEEDSTVKKILSVDFAQQHPLKILIVEDNLVNQKLAERVLTKLGYLPDKALNGQEALHALDKKSYDLILMDVQMPIMDGLEATRKIRLRNGAQPVIIAMTANALQGDREECIQAGMNDYISKPIKLENLISLFEKWVLHIRAK